MGQKTDQREDDIIDLKVIFAILKKRVKLILALTLLIALLSALYAYFIAKPVYAVKFMVEVGQIGEKPIENIDTLKEKLSYLYKVSGKSRGKKLPYVKSIIAKKETSLLLFTVIANNNDEGVRYAHSILDEMDANLKKQFDDYKNIQLSSIKSLQEEIDNTNKNITQIAKELAESKANILASKKGNDLSSLESDLFQAGEKQAELQSLNDHLWELKNKEQALTLSISPTVMRSAHMVGEMEKGEKPVAPDKRLIIITNLLSGLLFSIFLALVLEFITNLRNPDKQTLQEN